MFEDFKRVDVNSTLLLLFNTIVTDIPIRTEMMQMTWAKKEGWNWYSKSDFPKILRKLQWKVQYKVCFSRIIPDKHIAERVSKMIWPIFLFSLRLHSPEFCYNFQLSRNWTFPCSPSHPPVFIIDGHVWTFPKSHLWKFFIVIPKNQALKIQLSSKNVVKLKHKWFI